MTSPCLSISKNTSMRTLWLSTALTLLCSLTGCASISDDATENILHGTIAYPFADQTKPIGKDPTADRFIIRSSTGTSEYSIEIPGAARDYDIMIPLAAMDAMGAGSGDGTNAKPKEIANPASTDREIVSALPQIENRLPGDAAMMDGAFGVGKKNGPTQSPSYTLSIAKINNLYKARKYEYALIEINNMIGYYPNSPQLHKMKGTIFVKLQNFSLAEKSWVRALDLAPEDATLRRGLERLQQRISQNSRQTPASPPQRAADVPLKQYQPVRVQSAPGESTPIDTATTTATSDGQDPLLQDPNTLPPPTGISDEPDYAH